MKIICDRKNKVKEEGSVLVVAIIMLVLLTLIGIAATTTTQIETQVAGNDLLVKRTYYCGEAGVMVAAKILRLSNDDTITTTSIGPADGGVSFDYVMKFIAGKVRLEGDPANAQTSEDNYFDYFKKQTKINDNDFTADTNKQDILLTDVNGGNVVVDVQFLQRRPLEGVGTEFGNSGNVPSVSSEALDYIIISNCAGPNSSQSVVTVEYQYVKSSDGI